MIFFAACADPAQSALASAAFVSTLFWTLDCWNLPPQGSRILGISVCLHVVASSPGWSDSLSLHFHLDDIDLHCVFDLLVHLTFPVWWNAFLAFTVGWTRVLALFTAAGSCLAACPQFASNLLHHLCFFCTSMTCSTTRSTYTFHMRVVDPHEPRFFPQFFPT